ncbi:uncharacterized protein LOC114975403 [Acropora millepora]|uniref:uncharacterized protein LOC114975403 n=1 Tax=Acropora millepora TaxID=45264 RepID=UPI001CF31368|nr:uncharacterized protein LOC114975403 [Acropora millepora]
MSEIVTSLLKAIFGLLFNKARDSAAEKLKYGDVTDKRIRELIQREIDDIKSKLDALSRKDLLTAIDAFEAGVGYFCQAQDIDTGTIRSATSTKETKINGAPTLTTAIKPAIKSAGISELGAEVKESMLEAKERFKMAREEATKAFNNEALDTLQRITAIRYRVMAALLESVAKGLAATTDFSSPSVNSALQSAAPECGQSLRQLHSLPDVKSNFEVALRSDLLNIRGRFGRDERREIICAVCQVNRFIYDAQEFNFDHYDWATIKIGEKSINPLYSMEVVEVLDKAGMQHCCIRIEWSFGQNEELGHRLNFPTRIATNTYREFLVVDGDNKTIKVFDSSGKFIYKINPQVDDTVRIDYVADVATDVNNNSYTLLWLREFWTRRYEVQVFTKTEMCRKFPVRDRSSRLTVGHDRVFVVSPYVIAVYELNGIPIYSIGEGTLSFVRDIAAGSDGQIFVLNHAPNNEKIAYVFTEDGHQQNSLRVDSKEDDYFGLASYPSGEHIVSSGFELKTRRLKLALYRKDGVFNRSVTLGERLFDDNMMFIFGIAIAVTDDGKVAIPLQAQRKVIVRPMKPC